MSDVRTATAWKVQPPAMRHELHYGGRMVRCFEQRPTSMAQMLVEAVQANPEGEALVCEGERLRWHELMARVQACAGGLAALGVGKGDRVAVLVANRNEFVVAVLATVWLGAVSVPISVREQMPGVEYVLNHCTPRVVVFDAGLAHLMPPADATPSVEHRVAVPALDAALPWQALQQAAPVAAAVVDEEDAGAILYTSGTTGRPKGAVLTHLGIVHSAMHFASTMALTAQDRCACVVPLGNVTGMVAMIMTMVRCAGTLVVVPAFKAAEFLALAARERITYTLMVPAMYNLCVLQGDMQAHDLSAWRVGAYGGAPMPRATIDAVAARLPGLTLMNVYGATETTSPATMMPPGQTPLRGASVGVPLPCVDLLVVDEATGRELPRGESGEIWIAGPTVVKGYWDNPTATAQEITAGYWHTGDLGLVDADGYVHVFDRRKDMINRAGMKIYSIEVESTLTAHDAVAEAAVVARPCPVLGERVHAFVVGRGAVDAQALLAFCRERLADYKVPETITVLDEPLPRNANGKVLKRQLRERLA